MKNTNPDLQSMLQHVAEENIQPEQIDLWPVVQADLVKSKLTHQHKEFEMKKRFVFTALAAALAFVAVAIYSARSVTSVSAKEILDRASAAQGTVPTEGILHLKTETYYNLEAIEGKGTQTTLDSYSDIQSNLFRNVIVNTQTGNVMDAFAYDGANTYSRDFRDQETAPLTIYRTPQGQLASLKPGAGVDQVSAEGMFAEMQKDPNVKFVGEQTWDDGRKVYVLQSRQPLKVIVKNETERPMGLVMVYFDAKTYKQLGYRMTMQKDGKEILVGSQKILADEVLPVGTPVAWDLSDVQGIKIVDDPERIHGDLLPEVISAQELATKTKDAYLLKIIPEGYSLEISEPQIKPGSGEPYMYIATYRNQANNYFVIQPGTGMDANSLLGQVDDTYTAPSGLELLFMKDIEGPADKTYISAFIETPNGAVVLINSTLPRATVKQWADDLVLVK